MRDDIIDDFKDFPEVINILDMLKRTIIQDSPAKLLAELMEESHLEESYFINAIFGRDVIGKYNKKVVDSL